MTRVTIPKFKYALGGEELPEIYQKPEPASDEKPSYETNVLWALMQAGYRQDDIAYQYAIDGGRLSRNGLIVDFVLYTPSPIPIQVGASWWHRDSGEESLEDARILAVFGRLPVRIFDTDADTREHALASVMREIGHG